MMAHGGEEYRRGGGKGGVTYGII